MSSVNETFFSPVFPRLLFCLLVVSIISRVMSHIIVDMFPSHPPSLFLSPTHTHKQMSKSRFHTHSLLHTHPYKIIKKISYGAHLFLNKLFFFNYFNSNPCLFCAQCYLCLFCVLEKRKQHFYTIYVNKLLLLQF